MTLSRYRSAAAATALLALSGSTAAIAQGAAPASGAAASERVGGGAWDDTTATISPEQPLKPMDWAPGAADQPAKADKAVPFEVLAPINAALKAALDKRAAAPVRGVGAAEQRKQRDAIAFFYAARGFQPLWSDNNKAIAAVPGLLDQLARASEDGLDLPNAPIELIAEGTDAAIGESDVALTAAVVSYARQASGARVDPRTIGALIGLHPVLAEPSETLEKLAAAGEASGRVLQGFNPTEPRYVALRDKLKTTFVAAKAKPMKGGASATDIVIPPGPSLHVGMRDARVPLLRARFHVDDIGESVANTRYDAPLADAVTTFQRDNDLPATGVLTRATIAALSGDAPLPVVRSDTRTVLLANMEMWRWMPHDLQGDRVEVNIPDFQVTVFHDNKPSDQHRVVVGKPDTPTPLFSNAVKYLIVNPYWNVPQSIIRKEMLPKGGGDLSYLDGRGYSVSTRGGQWVVKQLPGDKNALGRIKFLFPNDYAVYLHDTPSKALFSAKSRAFSHGCVRVDQPFGLAESLLNDAAAEGHQRWDADRLQDLIGDKEHYINLGKPLPIHIAYFTATVDADTHSLRLRDDVYGYAGSVAAALGLAPSRPPAQHKPQIVAERPHRRSPRPPEETGFANGDDADPR